MILGQITIKVEYIKGRARWIYCRPSKYPDGTVFPNIIGVAHVIFLEKCFLTEHIETNKEYTFYCIFDKIPTNEQMDSGFIRSKIQPITKDIYDGLVDIYPQKNHRFYVS